MEMRSLLLPVHEINYIVDVLADRPWREVHELIPRIIQQGNPELPKSVPDEPKV